MANVEDRGFRYPLAAVQVQREWLLDRAQSDLAHARALLHECETRLQTLQQRAEAASTEAAGFWRRRADPAAHAGMLSFLAQVHQQRKQLERERVECLAAVSAAERRLLSRHRDTETLRHHRKDAAHDFRAEQARKVSIAADEAWSARAGRRGPGHD